MSETDSENRSAARRESAHRVGRVRDCLWISGTVREKNTIRFFCENGLSGGIRRHDSYSCIMLGEQTKNVALDPEIVGDDVALRFWISPCISLFRGHA